MRRILVLFALCVVVAIRAGAGENFCRVELSFLDLSTQAPIPGLLLRLDNPGLGLRRDMRAGADGRALIFDLEPGIWRAEAVPEGYEWMSLAGLRCVPGGLLRLEIPLKPTTADEGLSLGDASEIDTSSPRSVAYFSLPEESLPREGAERWAARARDLDTPHRPEAFIERDLLGPESGEALPLETWSRRRPGTGSLELGLGVGAAGKLVRSRGASTSEDLEIPLIFDWVLPLANEKRLFLLAAGGLRHSLSRSAMAEEWEGPISRNRSREDFGHLSLDLESSSGHSLAFELYGSFGLYKGAGEAATLYDIDGIPRFDTRLDETDAGGRLRWSATERLQLDAGLDWSLRRRKLDPRGESWIRQDMSPDGMFSSGFGRAVYFGEGSGLPETRDRDESFKVSLGLIYSPSSRGLLEFAMKYSRRTREFKPRVGPFPWSMASTRFRDQSAWGGAIDVLDPARGGRGVSNDVGISLSWIRDIAPGLTIRMDLEMEDRDFDAGPGREGVHFDFGQTFSPGVALIWDFMGDGRSRAWAGWTRNRSPLGEMLRLRLAGSLVSAGGSSTPTDPKFDPAFRDIEIDPGLDPPSVDFFSLGVEREMLAHLRIGAVVSIEEYRNGIALLQPGDRMDFLLAAPQPGPLWDDALERDTTSASLWIRKTPSSGWQALLNIGWVGQTGTWEGDPILDLSNPDVEYSSDILSWGSLNNSRGPLDGDRRFFADCSGSWYSESGLSLGAHFFWRMGAPLSLRGAMDPGYGLDTRFVAPRGSAGRGPSSGQLDLNLLLPLGGPDLRVEILNLFFQQKAEEIDQRWSTMGPSAGDSLTSEEQYTPGSFGKALRYQAPPELRVSLIWRW